MALSKIHGHWEYSYQRIFDFKEEIVRRNPGSHVEVKLEVINGEYHFQRVFLAFGPCIQGFLNGCRPYIALDGCHLKGKHRGVLVSATSIDGNSSIFPVAFGVVESENSNSWEWFLHGLKTAIGDFEGLVFSSDRQKGLDEAVQVVYPRVEHRECMRHLYANFKKKFRGDCYRDSLWAAARAYTPNVYETSIAKVYEANPMAFEYLRQNHSYLWSRSKFGTIAKCDYLTNNIFESFNAWLSNDRHRPLIDMLDTIRQKIMVKMEDRRNRARKWDSEIVPTVLKYVNNISKGLGQYEVLWSDEFSAEVIGPQSRFEVRLHDMQCSCRLWQVKGVPCIHAMSVIGKLKHEKWENYVHPYFTVAKYKEAYASSIAPLPSCDQWVKIDIGLRVLPPILKRPAGRPRNKRIRASDEMAIRKRHRCKRCNKLGHRAKTCKNPVDVNQQAAAGPSEAANQQPAAGPSQAANQQPAAAGNQQPTGPPQVGNQHSRAPIQAENQQAGDPHSEPPSQTSISSGKRRRGKRVASRSRYLQSQDGSTISEIDALGSLEN
ncbi:uncharacterized protein LOC109721429 [Ananas comosus]|uniref:Uncharacterized protein LOC109721429 n=1 Tax=Ananas comosus TaxID=4615 RepID=A0A6P5GA16_ANACO|nr:uncharacterized protein LOC109721429 [Ananas comosus]